MRPNLPKYLIRVPLLWIVSASILLVLGVQVLGQRPAGPPGTPANDPNDPINQERTNKADLRDREWLLGNNRKPVRKPGLGPDQSAALQIREDFERIQFINREMIKAVFADRVVDNKQILKTVSEIRKRAARLRASLAYPEPENPHDVKTAATQSDTDIKVLLAGLDRSLMSFVTNPIFQLTQQVVEADLARKASGDLRDVMEQSDKIKKKIEMLDKVDKH